MITVAGRSTDEVRQRARTLSERYGLPLVERGHKAPLSEVLVRHPTAFVVEAEALTLWCPAGRVQWTPGMAHLRIDRIDKGDRDDALLRFGELTEGDALLDCTLGFGQDALVAARLVGEKGRVVGIEKSLPLYVLTREGLLAHGAPVEVQHADSAELLKTLPDRSFDVVLFDPMFEKPRKSQPQFEALRFHADYAELTREMLDAARRIARRAVLVKASRYSTVLKKLDLVPLPPTRHATVVWAKLSAR